MCVGNLAFMSPQVPLLLWLGGGVLSLEKQVLCSLNKVLCIEFVIKKKSASEITLLTLATIFEVF